jgi:hypothetical protein
MSLQVGDKIYCTYCTIIECEGKIGIITFIDEYPRTLRYKIRFSEFNLDFWGDGFKASELLQALI